MGNYKVLHYVVGFSTLSETFIYDLITGLEQRNICTNFVACRKRTLEKERPFSNTRVLKEKNIIFRTFYKISDPEHMQLQEGRELKKLIKKFNPDIIHAHFGIAGIRVNNFMQKEELEIPLVVSFHGSDVLYNPHNQKGYLRNLIRMNHNSNLVITTPTNFLKRECLKLGLLEEKFVVMNNTVNKMFLNAKQSIPWDGLDKLKIVILGRLVPMKGHEIALQALHELKKNFENFELHILGDGRTLEKLQKLTAELGLEKEVIFRGPINHEDLPEELSKFHISITPSIKAEDGQEESFCISLIEASLCGLHCLASDAGGPDEVLKDKREFIYPQKDFLALASKLSGYIENFKSKNEKILELQKFMLANYHPDQYFSRYDSLYKSRLKSI